VQPRGRGWPNEEWLFDSLQGKQIYLFSTVSQPALGPMQPHIKWILGDSRLVPEDDHLPPPSSEVKNAWSCTSTPHISSGLDELIN
jgi:hypothetical protein